MIIGAGSPLLILHGLFGESKNWLTIAKGLSSFFEVHLIDQRNHGNSFHHTEHNYTVLAEDINSYMNNKNIAKCALIGHSMGGKVAMQFSVLYPDKLNQLVVVDVAPKIYQDKHGSVFKGLSNVLAYAKSRKQAQQILLEHLDDIVVTNFLLKGLRFSQQNEPKFKFNLHVLEKNRKNLCDTIYPLKKFNSMVYFLFGSKSNYIKPSDTQYISELYPLYQLLEIPQAGHWVHFEQKERFLNTIKTILK